MPSPSSRLLALAARALVRPAFDAPVLDIARFRRANESRRLMPALLPRGVRVEPSRDPRLPGEWIVPADVAPRRTLLHLHGGALVAGSVRAWRPLAAWIAVRARARVLVLDYRLAPEHPFPAALEDVVGAVRACYAMGTDHHALGLCGDSAGGGLALAALFALRAAGDPLPAAAALLSPLTDLAGTGESIRTNALTEDVLSSRHQDALARAYAAGRALEDPLISPLYGDFHGLPSLLIHASEQEMLFDDARRVAEKARAAGVAVEFTVWVDQMHDWHTLVPLTPEARQAVKGVAAYFARRVG